MLDIERLKKEIDMQTRNGRKEVYIRMEDIKELCEGMLGGDISINPNKHKDRTSCDFCIYNAICQFDSTLKDNNYNIIKDKKNEEIIRMMAEEVE